MKVLKILGIVLAVLVLLLIVLGIVFNSMFPKVGVPADVRVQATPELLARGEYLVNHVSMCLECHSQRDFTLYAAPVIPETRGAGGAEFKQEDGVPGHVVAPNITPFALNDWTDGEIIRAIRQGVSKDGRALFPIMAYPEYKFMRDEDVQAIVAYLRTLPAIEKTWPATRLNFPMNLIVKMIPGEATPMPPARNAVERGEYLVHIADCAGCHTPKEKGKPVPDKHLAGGMGFHVPGGMVFSANITPDEETGIGSWEKEDFILRFKSFADSSMQNIPVGEMEYNTEMPWIAYSGMTEQDLSDIFAYLMSIPAVKNAVVPFVAEK